MTNLIDGENVPLYGEGSNIRDWLHVDDHCRGIHLVLTGGRPGEVYNIGGGTELTNKELTGLLLEATGTDWDRVERVTDRLGHDLRYSVDITKISDELGYQPQVPFEQGLADTVEWYRDQPRLVGAAQGPGRARFRLTLRAAAGGAGGGTPARDARPPQSLGGPCRSDCPAVPGARLAPRVAFTLPVGRRAPRSGVLRSTHPCGGKRVTGWQ